MIQTSCKDCKKRIPGCHDECDNYKDFKAQKKLENDNARKYRCNSIGWDGYHKHSKKRGEL